MNATTISLYDTTLRDGTQGEGIALSCDDKLKIARRLDEFGMAYIEGGWPGSNPKDMEFFERAQRELNLRRAKVAAFGSTCKADADPADDPQVQLLIDAHTPVVTIFGKTWDLHVTEVLRTTLPENLRMIGETVRYLRQQGREVVYDAEHFFDGYRANPEYALETLKAAILGGAAAIVLCDTNGGSLPWQVGEAVDAVMAEVLGRTPQSLDRQGEDDDTGRSRSRLSQSLDHEGEDDDTGRSRSRLSQSLDRQGEDDDTGRSRSRLSQSLDHEGEDDDTGRSRSRLSQSLDREGGDPLAHVALGIHAHNDSETGVANTLEAVRHGCTQVQGTINGYGERCGNANLVSIIPDLQLKMGYACTDDENLRQLVELSRYVSELANQNPDSHQPFVGQSAFAHKGGTHVNAVVKYVMSYQHIDPSLVGNETRVLLSELAGKDNIAVKRREFGLEGLSREQEREVLQRIKDLENAGFAFESAEASVDLMLRRVRPDYEAPFEMVDYTATVEHRRGRGMFSEATVKVKVGDRVLHEVAEGNGPVNALNRALRKAIGQFYPRLRAVHLTDYKVRILDSASGTAAMTRVLIDFADGERTWTNVGASTNIIEASWIALSDSVEYYILTDAERNHVEYGMMPELVAGDD